MPASSLTTVGFGIVLAKFLILAVHGESLPCPDVCYPASESGMDKARVDCILSPQNDTVCDIKNCFAVSAAGAIEKGFKCGCVKCPDVCQTKFKRAKKLTKKCKKDPYRAHCNPLPCLGEKGKPGVECTCPIKYPDCPEICRKGKMGAWLAKLECETRPFCNKTDRKCIVLSCRVESTSSAKKGKMCGCPPLVAPISGTPSPTVSIVVTI